MIPPHDGKACEAGMKSADPGVVGIQTYFYVTELGRSGAQSYVIW
jgi:hypothetical protein